MNERKLDVYLGERLVGTLAETADHRVAFAYADAWLEDGFAISPFSLPVEQKVFVPGSQAFQGLWGVFVDSLPDAWGRLLVNRMLKHRGLSPEEVTPLERLAIVGSSGMGTLTSSPGVGPARTVSFEGSGCALRAMSGAAASGGCRRPGCTFSAGRQFWRCTAQGNDGGVGYQFPASRGNAGGGAHGKGIHGLRRPPAALWFPKPRLLPSQRCGGYFAVRRFDREQAAGQVIRCHMLTAAAILETDWRTASMDYHTLMKLTRILSRSNAEDTVQMYRRMCFNVFAHNRDDHAKNFSWLYDLAQDCWHPSPAYDLTWSTTYYGEHATTVDGNGRNPGMQERLAVGKVAGMKAKACREIAEEIREKTEGLERRYRGMRS